jgi:hypothetical protein
MDRVSDGGRVWREKLAPILNSLGIIVMNPCDKPYEGAVENDEGRAIRREFKKKGHLEVVERFIAPIRDMDLHMVNVSDFLIISVDIQVHMCGSYEELTVAHQQKKPILSWVQQGRNETPDWLLSKLPASSFFSTIEDLVDHLRVVNGASVCPPGWYTPKFSMLYDPKVLGELC